MGCADHVLGPHELWLLGSLAAAQRRKNIAGRLDCSIELVGSLKVSPLGGIVDEKGLG